MFLAEDFKRYREMGSSDPEAAAFDSTTSHLAHGKHCDHGMRRWDASRDLKQSRRRNLPI
jgi:hypothetical protein